MVLNAEAAREADELAGLGGLGHGDNAVNLVEPVAVSNLAEAGAGLADDGELDLLGDLNDADAGGEGLAGAGGLLGGGGGAGGGGGGSSDGSGGSDGLLGLADGGSDGGGDSSGSLGLLGLLGGAGGDEGIVLVSGDEASGDGLGLLGEEAEGVADNVEAASAVLGGGKDEGLGEDTAHHAGVDVSAAGDGDVSVGSNVVNVADVNLALAELLLHLSEEAGDLGLALVGLGGGGGGAGDVVHAAVLAIETGKVISGVGLGEGLVVELGEGGGDLASVDSGGHGVKLKGVAWEEAEYFVTSWRHAFGKGKRRSDE